VIKKDTFLKDIYMDTYQPHLGLTLVIAAHHKEPKLEQKYGEIRVNGYKRKRINRSPAQTLFKIKRNTMVNLRDISFGLSKNKPVKISHVSIGYRGLVLFFCTFKKPKTFKKGENLILEKGTLKVTL
jgi:hypothetical protein